MTEPNETPLQTIDRLHTEAEELAERAKVTTDPATAETLRKEALRRVKAAARIRADIELREVWK